MSLGEQVHVIAGSERARLAFLVLENAAFVIVGEAGIECPRDTAHDVHVVCLITRGKSRPKDRDSPRGSHAREWQKHIRLFTVQNLTSVLLTNPQMQFTPKSKTETEGWFLQLR